jgi:mono/diheme cytochrome c family protein
MSRSVWKGLVVLPVLVVVGFVGLHSQRVSSQELTTTFSAHDPGVRAGTDSAGGPLGGLSANQQAYFNQGKADFAEAEDVDEGMGPRMNLDSCGGCHAQPAIGGSSPAVNPQVAFATKDGGIDKLPAFIKLNGPVREARLVRNPDGTADGGVAALFTITGRPGADGCHLTQPDFATQLSNRNVIFRTPTPVFGAGLIEQIEDSTILANLAASSTQKSALGIRGRANIAVSGRTISGVANRNGNDGTITRFGWKAQNVSLLVFSGEAYNVEMGITSELFQNEREQDPGCYFKSVPNSVQDMDATTGLGGTTSVQNFANFQRLLAPPKPSTTAPGGATSITRGRSQFASTGCAFCHTPTLRTTDTATVAALRSQDANLFSDLLIHDMGVGLADGVSQGQAGPRDFRSAPLWGLGQRIFFLHDGRTRDLVEAIQAHQSDGSEANGVVNRFNSLAESAKQDLLNFLRSL